MRVAILTGFLAGCFPEPVSYDQSDRTTSTSQPTTATTSSTGGTTGTTGTTTGGTTGTTKPRTDEWCTEELSPANFEDASGDVTVLELDGTAFEPTELTFCQNGTLRFCPGTHYASITITQPTEPTGDTGIDGPCAAGEVKDLLVYIEGRGTADEVVLSGGDTVRVMELVGTSTSAMRVFISNLTLTEGYTTASGGALKFDYARISITDSVISESEALEGGGGVYVSNQLTSTMLEMTSTTVSGNVTGGNGGGLSADAGSVLLDGTTISANAAEGAGGGVSLSTDDTQQVIRDSSIIDNTAESSGGGIYHYEGGLELDETAVERNTSGNSGGGLFLIGSNTATTAASCTGGSFTGNLAATVGGGVTFYSDHVSSFSSAGCDWGEGKNDNAPGDVYVTYVKTGYTYDGVSDFTCDSTGCVEE